MVEIPADLLFNILLWLPVKTLLRLRCVSRAWRDVIDSRNFAKSHLNNLTNRPPCLLQLAPLQLHAAKVVDMSRVRNGSSPLPFKEIPFPFPGEFTYFVGQCNGLVCLTNRAAVFLWNPATRKQFQSELPVKGFFFRGWGFGYDNGSDDFKVVAMAKAEAPEGAHMIWIYSLRSRSWKQIDDFPYLVKDYFSHGELVNGALHWRVRQGECYKIGALHLGKLEYNLVPELDYYSLEYDLKHFGLGVLDGRLYVIYYFNSCYEFDLWTMNEYGVKESWTRLIRCSSDTRGVVSLVYFIHDEVLLFNRYCKEAGYEFRIISRSETKSRSIGGPMGALCPYVYVPSLVCPQTG